MSKQNIIQLEKIIQAQSVIKDHIVRTPLLKLNTDDEIHPDSEIFLKPENLQHMGSFKVRGAINAIRHIPNDELTDGLYTATGGNFGQGLAWSCNQANIPCSVVVPDHCSNNKRHAMENLGAQITSVPFDIWWRVVQEHNYENMKGKFVHPVSNTDVIAGNGTIGLEIYEDLPDIDTVLIPYGGGGLLTGIASALKQLKRDVKVYACEIETAAPLQASLEAGRPVECDYQPSFVDGIGSKAVLPDMWPYVSNLLDGSITVSLAETASAIKLLVNKNRIVVEGAGATTVAAALSGKAGHGKIVCVLSGGNIDSDKLVQILQGKVPT